MTIKEHLRSICSYEKTIHEANLKLDKMRLTKEDAKKDAEKKREELQKDVDKKLTEIYMVEEEIKNKKSRSEPSALFEIVASSVVFVVLVLFQALIRFLVVDVMNGHYLHSATVNFAIVYAVVAAIIFLVLHYQFLYDWGAFFACLIGFAVVLWITHIYLSFAISNGISINDAIVYSYILLDILVAICAVLFCISSYKADENAYNANLQEIRHKQKLKEAKEAEGMQLKEKVAQFDDFSKRALSDMQLDIERQEKYIKDTKAKLATIYAQNVLHPNYQNWVAAATIYEYLDVGRCYELKGPTGAYNLYEQELIAKKILDSLSAINHSISYYGSNISSSQHYIRGQLSECNRNVERMAINRYGL